MLSNEDCSTSEVFHDNNFFLIFNFIFLPSRTTCSSFPPSIPSKSQSRLYLPNQSINYHLHKRQLTVYFRRIISKKFPLIISFFIIYSEAVFLLIFVSSPLLSPPQGLSITLRLLPNKARSELFSSDHFPLFAQEKNSLVAEFE